MGIPCFGAVLKNGKTTGQNFRLKNCKLVIDVTESMYWFIKVSLFMEYPYRMDRYGFDMVKFGQFFHNFFDRLEQAKVTPIVVFSGARPSQQKHGDLASKAKYLEKSSRIRMYVRNRYGVGMKDCVVPKLAENVLRQIISDRKLETHQSVYEVYPLLAQLAERYDCPVMTSHSDFVLTNVKRGFFFCEDLAKQSGSNQVHSEIPISRLFLHNDFLTSYRLERCGPALVTLYTLMRSDFSGKNHQVVNKLFSRLPDRLRFIRDDTLFRHGVRPPGQPSRDRLRHILENWPKDLVSPEAVRRELATLSNNNTELLREYDSIHDTYSRPYDFMAEIGHIVPALDQVQYTNLHSALTKRESTADFCMDILMNQKLFNRGSLDDTETFRSSFSFADPARKCIMSRGKVNSLTLLDRQRQELQWRTLQADGPSNTHEFNRTDLFGLFDFPTQVPDVTGSIKIAKALNGDRFEDLRVMLLIAKYTIDKVTHQDYNSRTKSLVKSTTFSESSDRLDELNKNYRPLYGYFLTAIYNCFIYYASKNSMLNLDKLQNDPSLSDDANDNSLLPKIRIACCEIESNKVKNPDTLNGRYINMKHMIEAYNDSLSAYCQINSLFNYPAVRLQLDRYYNGVLIYRLMNYLNEKNGRTLLLQIEASLYDSIN